MKLHELSPAPGSVKEAFRKGMKEEGYEEGFNDGFDNGFDNGFTEAIVTFIKKSHNNNVPTDAIITQLKSLLPQKNFRRFDNNYAGSAAYQSSSQNALVEMERGRNGGQNGF